MSPSDYELSGRTRIALYALADNPNVEPASEKPSPGAPEPRIVVADHNQQVRVVVGEILSKCKVAVVDCALDGAHAIDAVFRLQPDILILDIIMPVMDGIRVTRQLRRANSPTRIIILTAIVDESFQRAAMQAGAQAYVIKARMPTDLPQAITAVMRGTVFRSSEQA